jgi:hypothetical protein
VRRTCEFLRGLPRWRCDKPATMVFHRKERDCWYCAEHYDAMIQYHLEKRETPYSWETLRLNGECR